MGVVTPLLVAFLVTAGDCQRSPTCRPDQLRLANGPHISPATGQNPLSFVLTNRSTTACVLEGYPSFALVDARGRPLPFRVSKRGDQMVTSRPPVPVHVGPRRSAFFVLNKYRCDEGNLAVARSVRVGLPRNSASSRLVAAIPTHPVIGYCGRNDPGSIVTVSPLVAKLRDARR